MSRELKYRFYYKGKRIEDGLTLREIAAKCDFHWADDVFLEAMEVLGVKPWRRNIMYLAVRAFGWLPWNRG